MVALIGIDCATQPNKVGLALGELDGERVRIKGCRTGSPKEAPASIVSSWLKSGEPALLALDAPLGWPLAIGQPLAGHQAGAAMGSTAHALFRRQSDDDIHERFGKRPLEVGANFISRTAVAALDLLADIRSMTSESIPLAWSPLDVNPIAAIEVYPAATRLAHGSKGKGGSIEGLEPLFVFPDLKGVLPSSTDAIDALVCVPAAADFIRGRARPPVNLDQARQEGWIWTAESKSRPESSSPGQRSTPSSCIAADLRSKQCPKGDRPGPAVIAGHGVGHGTSTQAADQATGVAALDLLLGSERWRGVSLFAIVCCRVPPGPWRCCGCGIVLNAASPAGPGDRPGPS